jgi:hypothetical protein
MEKNNKIIYLNKFISIEDSLRKQEKWRQKQISIYFRNGRPLFGKYSKK